MMFITLSFFFFQCKKMSMVVADSSGQVSVGKGKKRVINPAICSDTVLVCLGGCKKYLYFLTFHPLSKNKKKDP